MFVSLPVGPLPMPAGASAAWFGPSRRSPSGASAGWVFPSRPVACAFAAAWAARGVRASLRSFAPLGWSVSLPVSSSGLPFSG